ncbi:MAG: AarF/ABC1/UbiB kinase family protein [Candidatus Thermoplasmatota archaeon]|nr:AarF/ABC1/UbiB kinase family protein [Candidatus Thermoplasmatota archaeon]
MRMLTFFRFMRQILRKKPADLDWIQKQGLMAVKLAQIFALRPDLLGEEKCKQLQQLYQHAASIPPEDWEATLKRKAIPNFFDNFKQIDAKPLAAASVGQVHRATLHNGDEVVIKFVKQANAVKFRKEVDRMRSWLRLFLILSPRLRKVGNPMALLNHVADYTTRELDLRNEISGANELAEIQAQIADEFPTPKLRFPIYYPELSNENVLVSEFIDGISLEEGIENKSLEWSTLLELFRIHGAYLFGIGTFHGDLHPGNCIIDKEGRFVFIDNGAICHAPSFVNRSLFNFFEHLSRQEMHSAFMSLLDMTTKKPTGKKMQKYLNRMNEIYTDFEKKPVGEQSLTRIMMQTVRAAVELANAEFGEEAFPIIRALMYLDGLVIRTHPEVLLIKSMGPYLDEFRVKLGLDATTA